MLKRFFISTLATITGFWICIGLLFVLGFVISISAALSSTDTDRVDIKKHSVLRINLNGVVTERYRESTFMDKMQGMDQVVFPLNEAVAAIKEAKNNDKFDGIYLDCYGIQSAPGSLEELRAALEDFKSSGKWIYAYADSYSQADYYVASVADRLYVNPVGSIDLRGLSSSYLYYGKLLEKIGVEVQVFRVGTFKSAVEPFMLSDMSDANRFQIKSFIGNIWNNMADKIAESRGISIQDVNIYADDLVAFDAPENYLTYSLADELCYRHEITSFLKEQTSKSKDEDIEFVSPRQLCASVDLAHTKSSSNKIAVLYAYGDIVDSGNEGIVSGKIVKQINELIEDEDIDGLVFRVNSGGGSAFASEQIWEAIGRFRDTQRPVFVSMGDYAASGGYYISCGADMIYAQHTTLTGSIGIFGLIPCFENVMNNTLGISAPYVTTNDNANLSLTTKLNPAQCRAIQNNVERGYETFVGRCAEGRGVSVDQIKEIAEGRVWDGDAAYEIGLIDGFGTLDDVVAQMADYLDFDGDYQVIEYPKLTSSFWDVFEQMQDDGVDARLRQRFGEEGYVIYKQLEQLRSMDPIQCRMEPVIIK